MSTNKFKYFTVTQTSTVMARNKAEALEVVGGRRGVPGKLIGQTSTVDRVLASELQKQSATA